MPDIVTATLVAATVLCGVVAGFLWAFAVVVMPGIGRLDDAAFVRAFQEMDGIIQRGNPIFLLVWLGSVVALVGAAAIGIVVEDGPQGWALAGIALLYVAGVQLPTALVNLPLNSTLQRVQASTLTAQTSAAVRQAFEARWNRANGVRTWAACATAVLLVLVIAGR